MARDWLSMVRRGLKKPPRYIVQRVVHELSIQVDRHLAAPRASRLTATRLARQAGHSSVDEWWDQLARAPYVTDPGAHGVGVEHVCVGEQARIVAAAGRALAHRVDLLGSGPVELGNKIDWHRDYKTGIRWEPAYWRDIEYGNPGRPSDVKFPWEVSRMQWMLPLGQAYAVTRDERYATAARDLLEHWMKTNPYARSVNWSCAMEVALRILSWTWLFHALKHSETWKDAGFRTRFLAGLYLHADFLSRNLERSDVNGNHYTADAAGLVFAGLFFKGAPAATHWESTGWQILCAEFPRQVFEDGVDFEASTAYHRLVTELFLLPALYRRRRGAQVPREYADRLVAMARFTAAYSRRDGSIPLWGDADDARALPLGGQALNDHRYLLGLVGLEFGATDLVDGFAGPRSEVAWLLGPAVANRLPDRDTADERLRSAAFSKGGFYVLRNEADHVFVDCGPLGLAGRGGHGHNDLLSFEAVLGGCHIVADSGAYVYTANYEARNFFRSTLSHNTPRIDGEEINRFVRWDHLWSFHNDASHSVREIVFDDDADRLVLAHSGYERLPSPVTPIRTIQLEHATHSLTIADTFRGQGEHRVEIPVHLAPGATVGERHPGRLLVHVNGHDFAITWEPTDEWSVRVDAGRISPSYGVVCDTQIVVWQRTGRLVALAVTIAPASADGAPQGRQVDACS